MNNINRFWYEPGSQSWFGLESESGSGFGSGSGSGSLSKARSMSGSMSGSMSWSGSDPWPQQHQRDICLSTKAIAIGRFANVTREGGMG